MSDRGQRAFAHPHDTPLSAGLRFGVELIAWIAAPTAVYAVSGGFAATVALSVLVA